MSSFRVSLSPHVRARRSTASVMRDVDIALVPAMIAGTLLFGWKSLMLCAVGTFSAVLSEWVWCTCMKKQQTIGDWSAAVTGLLLALNLPSPAPWWVAMIGSIFAIIIVKEFFGGLGQNFMNPAMAGRAFLLACWPTRLTSYVLPMSDTVTSATPLMALYGKMSGELPALSQMLLGVLPGSIGEVSKIALLLGFAYLLVRRVIGAHIPLIYLGVVFALRIGGAAVAFAGGAVGTDRRCAFGAIFMATDYVTSPLTLRGQCLFALGCGVITFVIRKFGAYPEGVTYAIC
jgi:electron transport complex protein RnfD